MRHLKSIIFLASSGGDSERAVSAEIIAGCGFCVRADVVDSTLQSLLYAYGVFLRCKINEVDMKIYFRYKTNSYMAEKQGFEPWEGINPQRFSRPPLSTAQPPLQAAYNNPPVLKINYFISFFSFMHIFICF